MDRWSRAVITARHTKDLDVLTKLVNHLSANVRIAATKNTLISERLLCKLANDDIVTVRAQVAEKITSLDILTKLAIDRDHSVRTSVAWNKNSSQQLLAELANDPDWDVRAGVAENPSTSVETLTKLVRDEDNCVRDATLLNPNTPKFLRLLLGAHELEQDL